VPIKAARPAQPGDTALFPKSVNDTNRQGRNAAEEFREGDPADTSGRVRLIGADTPLCNGAGRRAP